MFRLKRLHNEYLPPEATLSFKQGSMPPGISPACAWATQIKEDLESVVIRTNCKFDHFTSKLHMHSGSFTATDGIRTYPSPWFKISMAKIAPPALIWEMTATKLNPLPPAVTTVVPIVHPDVIELRKRNLNQRHAMLFRLTGTLDMWVYSNRVNTT